MDNDEIINYIDVLNIFFFYFKKKIQKKKNYNMFDDIDYNKIESTNRCLEFMYEHIEKYKSNQDNMYICRLYNPDELDISECEELYVLIIDDKQNKVCQLLYPIIVFLAEQDWTNIKWSINPIKTDT